MNEAEWIRPRRITPSFKIIPSLKTWLKRAYLHRSIDVKFIFDSALLGLSPKYSPNSRCRPSNCLLTVLAMFLAIFSPSSYSWNEWNVRHFFKFSSKTTQPRPQVFSVNGALTCENAAFFDVISSLKTKFFQIWSSVTGYGELNVVF